MPSTFLYQEPRLKIEHKTQEKVGSWIGWRIFYIRPFEISHESHIAVEHVVKSDASSDARISRIMLSRIRVFLLACCKIVSFRVRMALDGQYSPSREGKGFR